jgi:hypothetical protein
MPGSNNELVIYDEFTKTLLSYNIDTKEEKSIIKNPLFDSN